MILLLLCLLCLFSSFFPPTKRKLHRHFSLLSTCSSTNQSLGMNEAHGIPIRTHDESTMMIERGKSSQEKFPPNVPEWTAQH